ncbi:MAG: HDIG domain-containing protein [Polyangiaceae bacterium]
MAGLVMSIVAGALFTAVAVGDLYAGWLAPRFGAPTPVTLRVPYGPRIIRHRGDTSRVVYEHVRIVVPRGTVLKESSDDHRAAFAFESLRRPPSMGRLISRFVVYFFVCLMLTAYLRRFGQSRARLLRTQAGILSLLFCSLVLAKGVLLFTALPEFWVPMAALPLWVALVFDRRTAFLLEVAVSFVAASLLRFDLLLLTVLLVRGIAATLFFFSRRNPRQQMVIAGGLAGLTGAVAFIAMTIMFEGRFDLAADFSKGMGSSVLACVGGGLAAGILARVLREPAERLMGHVSREKLLDLTDLEQPLLKKMAAEAPGSWEHARAMANLAEASAAAIQADALLTRVGAYYHDLGKTVQCKYFIENLTAGERSPHEDLEPDVSADAIMAHVVMGTKILRDGKIPEPVVEFAYTHHGTQLVEYFWHKCREQGNPKGLSEDHFRYPGMKPQTKETAILMLVDSIEAASRTINPPEHKKFEEMIQRVIFTKLSAGQLDESGLTIEDLRVMTSRMASTLVNMYHGRVKYPWQREASSTATPPPMSTTAPVPSQKPKNGTAATSPLPAGKPADPSSGRPTLPATDASKTKARAKAAGLATTLKEGEKAADAKAADAKVADAKVADAKVADAKAADAKAARDTKPTSAKEAKPADGETRTMKEGELRTMKESDLRTMKEGELATVRDGELATRDLGTLRTVELSGGAPRDDDEPAGQNQK